MITKRRSYSRSSFTEDELDYDENSPIVHKISSIRKKAYKKWAKEEDDRLREYITTHNGIKDWSCISKYVGNGRTDAQCQHRWERFLDPSITKGPWTDEEDRKVIQLVGDYGAKHWSLIAKELKGRVGKQCRERWHNHLNPLINKNPWTNEENLRLFILHQHLGNRWAEIARYFNGRSDNSIKNHWNSSMKKKFHLEVENLKKQGLDWTALIPPDFPWPKFDESIGKRPNRSSRIPLNTITNQLLQNSSMETISSPLCITKTEDPTPLMNSNDYHQFFINQNDFQLPPTNYPDQLQCISTDHHSSQNVENLLFDFHSDEQQNLSSYQYDYYASRSSSLPVFPYSSSPHIENDLNLFSNPSSPIKYHVLDTPERVQLYRLSPNPKQDCFNEYLLPLTESITNENHSSTYLDKYDLSINISDKIGYNPTYTEILIGQTRDQRYMTEQARRYLSCSSLNYS